MGQPLKCLCQRVLLPSASPESTPVLTALTLTPMSYVAVHVCDQDGNLVQTRRVGRVIWACPELSRGNKEGNHVYGGCRDCSEFHSPIYGFCDYFGGMVSLYEDQGVVKAASMPASILRLLLLLNLARSLPVSTLGVVQTPPVDAHLGFPLHQIAATSRTGANS